MSGICSVVVESLSRHGWERGVVELTESVQCNLAQLKRCKIEERGLQR